MGGIPQQVQSERATPSPPTGIVKSVDEFGIDSRIGACPERLPPSSKGNFDDPATHSLYRANLRRWRGFRSDNRCGNAHPSGTECYPLCHVAGGGSQYSALKLLARCPRHEVRRATNLE